MCYVDNVHKLKTDFFKFLAKVSGLIPVVKMSMYFSFLSNFHETQNESRPTGKYKFLKVQYLSIKKIPYSKMAANTKY